MNRKQEDLLKSINNGILKGSQKKLAKALGISQVAVSRWLQGTQNPSQENYEKMSKIFKRSTKELEKIFVSNSNIGNNNVLIGGDLQEKLNIKDEKINVLEEKIKLLEEKIKFLEKKAK